MSDATPDEAAPAPPAADPQERFEPWNDGDAPEHYLPDDALRDAVAVAVTLGLPLLLTGEPGTGKTQLAYWLAHQRGGKPLVFDTKTTSTAQDLFYQYDSLRRFHDAQASVKRPLADYIELKALGLAIALAVEADDARKFLAAELRGLPPRRSVVLIDEVDKAPRDVPNDLLREIEQMRFVVREAGPGDGFPAEFRADTAYRPIVVLTSNSERNLPDAFLRRCVFHNLGFPDDKQLGRIVQARLDRGGNGSGPRVAPDIDTAAIDRSAIQDFLEIRQLSLKKKPGTAELLAWVQVLRRRGLDVRAGAASRRDEIGRTYALLAKTLEDLQRLRQRIGLSPVA
jgi:MoxR-like ATPase